MCVNRPQQSDVACDLHTQPYPFLDAERNTQFLHFLLKQIQIELSFIKLKFYDIKVLDLE